jgi:hypothetical protein
VNILQGPSSSVRQFKIDFTLTPAQKHIEENSRRFTFIRAGRKFGKTKYSEWKALQWMSKPNSCHWHVAPTYKQARLISWGEFKRIIPKEAVSKVNDSDLYLQLKNGSQLFLMGSDDKDSLRGPSPTSMTLEEAAYHRGDVWQEILEPNLAVHKGPALFISTPKGFNWFRDLEDNAIGDPLWATFHYTIYDNPHIDREEIERIKAKSDPRVWSQEYMAEYESSVGRVFHEFQDTSRHVYSFPLPTRSESCYRATDWGMRDDCGTLWGTLRGPRLFIYRENAENSLPPRAQAEIVLARTPKLEQVVGNIIGHDANKQDLEMQGLTVKWHFTNAGISPLRVSSRKKDHSRAALEQLFHEDRIVIHPECRKLRKQLLSYSWKDNYLEKPEDGNDDLVDSLHYMVEMLQYQLFLSPRKEESKSIEEVYAQLKIDLEAAKLRGHRYPLVQEKEGNMFDPTGNRAGYL